MGGAIRDAGDCLHVSGSMTLPDASALLTAGIAALAARSGGAGETVFDLTQVEAVDSSAIAVIFAWLREARRQGKHMRIVHPSTELLSLADVYGVGELLPLRSEV